MTYYSLSIFCRLNGKNGLAAHDHAMAGKKLPLEPDYNRQKNNDNECQGNNKRIEICNIIPCPGTMQFDRITRISINFAAVKTTA